MKQAILITAYKDLEFIKRIIQYFDDDFEFYIHVDTKCREESTILPCHKNVHVYSEYHIQWGGSNHLKAIWFLIKQSVLSGQYEYFHLITGSDYPIKPLTEFKSFFENHKLDNFIEYFPLPRPSWGADGGLRRILYYWPLINHLDVRSKWYQVVHLMLRIQRKLGIKRSFPYFGGKLWAGGTYWSLSAQAIECVTRFVAENPDYIKRFNYTAIGEEIFIQTILKNHPDICLTNNYLRFIDWGDGFAPVTLTGAHFDKIARSDCFFARKLDSEISAVLLQLIDDQILKTKA
jgi:hypothetical protein